MFKRGTPMNRTLPFHHTLTIGLMLFALFFGAGNLIFPAMLGQQAGDRFWTANLGFLTTGVGLPLLATMALGFSGSKSLLDLTARVHPWFAVGYTTLLYLTIGPLFAIPRTGTVSYEIGIKPFIAEDDRPLGLAVFSVLFFGISLLCSLYPSRIVDIVGKFLTPILVVFLALLAVTSVARPLGEPQAPTAAYASQPFFSGFQDGYFTMDALAAFVFGMIVIRAIQEKGVRERKSLLFACFRAALIAAALLAVIYTFLTYIGATSIGAFGPLANGGDVLRLAANHYFGAFGGWVLGIIVLLACLTTSIGLITACGSYLHRLVPGVSHRSHCLWLSVVSCLLANFGLNELIRYSVPALTILYPLAVVLIVLTFTHPLFKGKRTVYGISLLLAAIVALVDGLAETPLNLAKVHGWFTEHLPLYKNGLGWLLPAVLGMLIGLLPARRT
jgi:LIVCS family branched-chain amino acid:cation transporter